MTTVDFRYRPASSWTAICRPDESEKTLVREDGALLYRYRPVTWVMYVFDRVIELSLDGAAAPTGVEQRTERATRAILETTLSYPQAELRLRTFRHTAHGRAFDVVEWEIAVATDVDELTAALHVEVFDRSHGFTSGPGGSSPRLYAVGADEAVEHDWWYDAHDPAAASFERPDAEVALRSWPQRLAVAQATGYRPVAAFSTVPEHARGGATVRGALVVPLDGRDVPELDGVWVETALDAERRSWDGLFPHGLPIDVPDDGIRGLLEASARNLMQARERRGGRRVFQVGHALYRNFWIADGFFMLEAVRYLGLPEAADESLAALEEHVAQDGSIVALGDVGHIKETSIAIAMLARQAELAGRLDRLDAWWPRIDAAVEHIAALHASTFDLPEGAPARGLMPPAFGDGGVAGRRAEYTTMLWALAGLRTVADAAEHAGHPGAERYRAVLDELRAAFEEHRRDHLQRLPDGRSYLPMVLDGGRHHVQLGATVVAPEHELRPETATWALAQAIYPGEVFEPDEPLVQDFLHLLDLRDDEEQVPATTGWLPYRAVWTYYASFAAHAFLWAGRPDKAVEYLYGFANHAAPTGVWREEQPLRGAGHATVNGDMPHNWASAEFIRLVRNLLVFERGRELWLLAGLPPAWTRGPTDIDTPTRYGRVRVAVRPAPGRTIDVQLDPSQLEPERVVLHVPDGPWTVRACGSGRTVVGPGRLELAAGELACGSA